MLTIKRALLILILLVILIPLVNATGISPASFEIPYKPGAEGTYEYFARIKDSELNTIKVYTRGDLNDSIEIGEEIKTLIPGSWTRFQFKIKFPNEAKAPGLHENRLGVVEHNIHERSGVSVLAGAESKLLIRVPFEGRYLEFKSFEIPSGEVNKPVNFYVKVISRGKENVDSAVLNLDIINPQGQIIARIKSESITIGRDEEKTLNAQWQTDVPGPYSADGFIVYDNNFLELESKGFHVGDLLLKIKNISVPYVKKGDITKVYFDVESFWNVAIEDVYAELIVKNKQGETIGEEKSQSLTINSWSKTPMVMYWDSKNQEVGEYDGKIILHYARKTDETEMKIKIKNPSILEILAENIILTAGITVVILMLILNIIILLKKKRKRKKSK